MANSSKNNSVKCSFCGKMQNAVEKLIAGPGVFICDECIKACNSILEDPIFFHVFFSCFNTIIMPNFYLRSNMSFIFI